MGTGASAEQGEQREQLVQRLKKTIALPSVDELAEELKKLPPADRKKLEDALLQRAAAAAPAAEAEAGAPSGDGEPEGLSKERELIVNAAGTHPADEEPAATIAEKKALLDSFPGGRYPLVVDPSGAELEWLLSYEKQKATSQGGQIFPVEAAGATLKDRIEFCMGEGLPLIVTGVDDLGEPLPQPIRSLLERKVVRMGKNLYMQVSGQNMDFKPEFRFYMVTTCAAPAIPEELAEKVLVVQAIAAAA